MSSYVQDLKFALRGFARTPGVIVMAVVTLAIGVGANAAIFSVIHSVMIDPLPYPHADRVVIPMRTSARMGNVSVSPAKTDIEKWLPMPVFEAVTTYSDTSFVIAGGDEPEQLQAARVDARFLDFTGAHPVIGRSLNTDDTAATGGARVVILSDGLWRRRFGGDRAVVGRRVELSDQSYEIIGVLPASFRMPLGKVDLIAPLGPQAKTDESSFEIVTALGRLRPGVSIAAAEEQLTAAGVQAIGTSTDWRVHLMRPTETTGKTFQRALLVLFGAVGFVLLIACANVANLVLARNAARDREIAVRVALGAGRWRLVRQLLTENLLLSATGGVLGLALGVWGLQAIASLRPPDMRELEGLRLSWQMLAFGLTVAGLTGVAFGLYPAIAGSRRDAADALRQGGRSAGQAHGRIARRILSVGEIALALMLLAGAGLLIRSYARMQTANLGFNPERLIAMGVDLPSARYSNPAARAQFMRTLAERVKGIPGVRYAGLASGLPPRGGMLFGSFEIEGHQMPAAEKPGAFGGGWVQAGYFETMGIPIREGRGFVTDDERKGVDAIIINDRMAARYWPGESAVGKRARLSPNAPWSTVVGVVGTIQSGHPETDSAQIYHPIAGQLFHDTGLLVSTTGDPTALIGTIKGLVWSLDPKLPLKEVATLEARVAERLARPRFNLVLLSIFALIGLMLAVIGIYGVVSYSVGMRTREIGVRIALGALPSDIRRAVLGEAVVMAGTGIAIGLAGALMLSRFITSLVFEVSPSDPLTLIAVAVVLCASAIVAAWLPARRAMRVDPMIALRAE